MHHTAPAYLAVMGTWWNKEANCNDKLQLQQSAQMLKCRGDETNRVCSNAKGVNHESAGLVGISGP